MKKYLVVGAGLAGAVLANKLAENPENRISVVEKRNHLAGNCHTQRCAETGIMQHMYGAHIFHTSNKSVWDFINKFADFRSFINTPFAEHEGEYFSLPINLDTLERFFKRRFTPQTAQEFVGNLGRKDIVDPQNFREQGLMLLGEDLYYAFFHGYTKKQWGREPDELPASILKRLPVRFNYNRSYYESVYQGIPAEGYTEMVRRMLDHPNISVMLETAFDTTVRDHGWDHIFYSGPIDEFYGYKFGRLRYRTVFWDKEIVNGDFFGHSSINYPSEAVIPTRRREHKHYSYWETHEKSVVFTEYSKETLPGDEPFYPLGLAEDKHLFQKYAEEAKDEAGLTFIGRLATYRYLDMHQVIAESLDLAISNNGFPVFHDNITTKLQKA